MQSCATALKLLLFSVLLSAASSATERPFIRADGDRLFEGDQVFRFVSFNIPNLHLIEDAYDFDRSTPWRWPDEYEIGDALESIRQIGGRVARTYVISVKRDDSNMGEFCHVKGPNEFNEDGFVALDQVLATARERGVRVIIPLVDNWHWWGGIQEYAGFRGKPKEAFWTDPQVRDDFKATIKHVVTRKNTVNGIRYNEDPTILGWETGNELASPPEWTRDIARYIKSLDPNHLVIDGNSLNGPGAWVMDDPHVDVVTSHHYPNQGKRMRDAVQLACETAAGRKPHFVGEFGFVPNDEVEAILEAVQSSPSSGALLWSLRSHRREGGFYWHSEGSSGYKAYHWPGFRSGDDYHETELLELVRRFAYSIRGTEPPAIEVPAAPHLLPTDSPFSISWQGATGARSYSVQRRTTEDGPWVSVGPPISDASLPYRPLFVDAEAPPDQPLWYRVIAHNSAGSGPPSNSIGPLRTAVSMLVDEFQREAPMHSRLVERKVEGDIQWLTDNARFAQEDLHRITGHAPAHLTYQLDASIQSVRLFAFAAADSPLPGLRVSADGINYRHLQMEDIRTVLEASDYGQRTRILMEGHPSDPVRFLQIALPTENAEARDARVEVSRLELVLVLP